MKRRQFLFTTLGLAFGLAGCRSGPSLRLASYDATREAYSKLKRLYREQFPESPSLACSHGSSGSQARAVIDGLPVDLVSLAVKPDLDKIAEKGLIEKDWPARYDSGSSPFTSTIVFVVRAGNPFGIEDWPDLIRHPEIKLITANPKTSGAAKLGFIAAWGSAKRRSGSEATADEFVGEVFSRAPVLDTSSRAAAVTFARKGLGDVQLSWENDAIREKLDLGDRVQIVRPKSGSLRAEPAIAVVKGGNETEAHRCAQFLYSESAQRIFGANGYRPAVESIGKEFVVDLPPMDLFRVEDLLTNGWGDAQKRFFNDGGLFDRVATG